jgi:hypothetical protein
MTPDFESHQNSMAPTHRWGWALFLAANVVILGVLGLYRTTSAQTPVPAQQPFANSVQQRLDMIELLKETNRLLKEQNDLLRSGQVRVVVAQPTP